MLYRAEQFQELKPPRPTAIAAFATVTLVFIRRSRKVPVSLPFSVPQSATCATVFTRLFPLHHSPLS